MIEPSFIKQSPQSYVLDIYIFINPIDDSCLHCASSLLELAQDLGGKVYYHVIPFYNFQTITHYVKNRYKTENSVALCNELNQLSYLTALTYKAATFQGKKKAHSFFKHLKSFISNCHTPISPDHLLEAAKLAQLDIDMVLEDRQSSVVKQLYLKDLEIANRFNVTQTPSAIVFDSRCHSGILLELDVSIDTIRYAIAHSHKDIAQAK